ncbi:IS200/IS605 family transposase [Nonomuraea sp. NEAU-A123]|uniref:IS200/IS605 family transposase n=1 Tax=Nonomuraea sp. NEAU-A123 TaxID=2839649 RepID=UPI001BE3DC86|nr:IS200/IS605 family transposase [Nonomuraea sp. NEAU-A123]MBT2233883.1 IS200/IS605 family transposase [Nonomuraea sp. NEAU-A123]
MEQNPDVRKGRHCVHELSVHLVFVTKYRHNVFTEPMLTRCEEIMRNVCTDFGCELMEFNGADDHVHLLVDFPPKVALSILVNSLKGVSARYLRKEYDSHLRNHLWRGHLWSRSYYAGSTGAANHATVSNYIQDQDRPTR